jgi:hypothetical protein
MLTEQSGPRDLVDNVVAAGRAGFGGGRTPVHRGRIRRDRTRPDRGDHQEPFLERAEKSLLPALRDAL